MIFSNSGGISCLAAPNVLTNILPGYCVIVTQFAEVFCTVVLC